MADLDDFFAKKDKKKGKGKKYTSKTAQNPIEVCALVSKYQTPMILGTNEGMFLVKWNLIIYYKGTQLIRATSL